MQEAESPGAGERRSTDPRTSFSLLDIGPFYPTKTTEAEECRRTWEQSRGEQEAPGLPGAGLAGALERSHSLLLPHLIGAQTTSGVGHLFPFALKGVL